MDEKPEALEAREHLESLQREVRSVTNQLIRFRDGLVERFGTGTKSTPRRRRWGRDLPEGLIFDRLGVEFYVEFSIASGRGAAELEGAITWGATRPLCFLACPEGKRDDCQRVARCDQREDKALLTARMSKFGVITNVPGLKGSWSNEEPGRLIELHYRVLERVWRDALEWVGESCQV